MEEMGARRGAKLAEGVAWLRASAAPRETLIGWTSRLIGRGHPFGLARRITPEFTAAEPMSLAPAGATGLKTRPRLTLLRDLGGAEAPRLTPPPDLPRVADFPFATSSP